LSKYSPSDFLST